MNNYLNLYSIKTNKADIIEYLKSYYLSNNLKGRKPNIYYYWKSVFILINFSQLNYILIQVSISIITLIFKTYMFYAFFLLEIISYFEMWKNVVYAITKNTSSLSISSMLAVIIIYLYSLVGFLNSNEDFYLSSVNNGELNCLSIFQCVFHLISLAPRSSGSIGDLMIRTSYSNKPKYIFRYIYDLSIFLLINLIFLTIIFGFIIDTFSSLRLNKKNIDNDINNKCNVCSQDRYLVI